MLLQPIKYLHVFLKQQDNYSTTFSILLIAKRLLYIFDKLKNKFCLRYLDRNWQPEREKYHFTSTLCV